MAEKDYYSILGVGKTASADELKSAYKKMAKKWHPDVNKSSESTERFKEVNEAYSVLSDENKRSQYDQFGSESFKSGMGGGFPGGGASGAGFDFSDLFNNSNMGGFPGMEDLLREAFGSNFGGGTRTRRRQQAQHLRFDLDVTFEEAAFGTTKTISVPHLRACEECNGSGAQKGSKREKCATCHGRGVEVRTQRTPFGMFQTQMTCSKCGGEGEVVKDPCKTCRGKGIQNKTSTIEIKIPAGIDTGNHLRVPNQGNYSSDGQQGDLYVVMHVSPHDVFRREAADVFVEQKIPYPVAALGGEVDVPILGGNVTMTIPSGTQNGKVFRLREKGIRKLNSDEHGDEFVRVQVDVPTHLTSRQKELLEELNVEMNGGKDAPTTGETKKRKKGKKGLFGF